MARARNIKPGFFRNAELAELPIETRLLFPGLWVLADREGRLEDRPKQIKMEIYPADNFDVDSLLQQLHDAKMILRYEVDGKRYIQVINFDKHQNPHRDEKASSIPAPCKHHASIVQAQCKDDANRADSLIPDSLIPESNLIADKPQSKKRPKTPFPDDFFPNGTGITKAETGGVSVATELEAFRNHHVSKGNLMADWQAAWLLWVGNSIKWRQPSRASPYADRQAERDKTIAILTGKGAKHERSNAERDITGEAVRIA